MLAALRLRARAFAKINLGLRIVRRRRDGFHELRTVFQTIALADRLTLDFTPGRGRSVVLTHRGDSPDGEANLAFQAAQHGMAAFGLSGRAVLHLEKHIPQRAGLGGGSSDAAAVIRMLARIADEKKAPFRRQLELAAVLGSDVPPFLIGGTILGLGRGEEVYPLPDLGPWCVVLAMPADDAGVSTPDAFRDWDRRHRGLTPAAEFATIMEFCSLLKQVLPAFRFQRNRGARRVPKVQAGLENDFQTEVFSLSPDFPRIHHILRQGQAVWVSLSGSGAAQFGLFADAASAARAAARFEGRHRVWCSRFVARAEFLRGLRVERI